MGQGSILLDENFFEEALKCFNKALDMKPENSDSSNGKFKALIGQGNDLNVFKKLF